MTPRLAGALLALVAGCAGASPAASVAKETSRSADVPARAVVAPSVASALPLPSALVPSAAPAPLKLDVVQVLSVPVSAIALGEGTRIAVLADTPYVGDARGLRPLPIPSALRAKADEVEQLGIFFGRDNEPRIMGSRRSSKGETAVYWRHLPTGWRDGREEIGQLAGPVAGGLWGVLGSADPELVCRVNAVCIIKRTSGWTTAPAGSAKRVVTLQDGVLWGLDASGVAGIDAHGWALALPAPDWSAPTALWATRGEAWVSAAQGLFHFSGAAWVSCASPVAEVNAWWGARPDSIWLAGSGGAAHFDGHGFGLVPIAGPVRAVRARTDAEVWFGGDAGLFRVRPPG